MNVNNMIHGSSPRTERLFHKETDPVIDIGARRERDIRTRLLKSFDPKDPEKVFMEILQQITHAVEHGDEKTETALRGIEAVLSDERLRDRLFDAWENKQQTNISEDDIERTLNCYRTFLRRRDFWPAELASKLPPQGLIGLYVDLLVNKHFFLHEQTNDQKMLLQARKGLHDVFSSEVLLGKQVEWGFIGLLRYGPGVYAGTFSNTPSMYVAHTLPRQDLYGTPGTKKADLVWHLPGNQLVDYHALKSTDETHAGELNVIGPEVRWCYEQIADPNHEMSPMEWEEWRRRYQVVMEDMMSEMIQSVGGQVDAVKELREVLLPRAKRRQVEMVSGVDLDGAFTLEKMRNNWSKVLELFPGLGEVVGHEITIKNFKEAKLAFEQLYKKKPELKLWRGWIKVKRRKAS